MHVRAASSLALLTLLACSTGGSGTTGGSGGSGKVAGKWLGSVKGNSSSGMFLDLQQDGTAVSGKACENATGKDCSPLDSGSFQDPKLAIAYSFEENGKQTITLALDLSADGTKLTGSFHSTKCACDGTVDVTRQ